MQPRWWVGLGFLGLGLVAVALGGTLGGAADVPQSAPGASPDDAAMVSLVQLIGDPKTFDGRYVKIMGFLHLEFEGDAIWLHREDCEHRLYKNGLWVHTGEVLRPGDAPYNDRYVMIVGRFDAQKHGHLGLWSGEINGISRVLLWPPPKPAAGGLVPARPAERQVNVVVSGHVVPAVVKAGEPIPLTIRISNGLRASIFHETFRLEPVDWNGETIHINLPDIYRDSVANNLHQARPALKDPPMPVSGNRKDKYIRYLKVMAVLPSKNFNEMKREDVGRLVQALEKRFPEEWTFVDCKTMFKTFFRFYMDDIADREDRREEYLRLVPVLKAVQKIETAYRRHLHQTDHKIIAHSACLRQQMQKHAMRPGRLLRRSRSSITPGFRTLNGHLL